MRNKKILGALLAVTTLATFGLAGCGNSGSNGAASKEDDKTITVAASPTPHAEILNKAVKPLVEKDGYKLVVKEFTDYVQPNTATEDGEVDANYFQHKPYLDNFNKEKGTHLVSVEGIHFEPFGLYPGKTKELKDLQDGATVAVPNDATNEARALQMLASLNLIKLADNLTSYATVVDIVENPLELNIYEMDASMIGSQMSDSSVAAGFMNGQYATQAGYPHESAIAIEAFDPNNADPRGIVNIIAARETDAENPVYLRIAEAYQCDEVAEVFETLYKGSFEPAW